MAGKQASISSAFRGYPVPKESPDTGYVSKPGANPILRGIPLAIAASACVCFAVGFIAWLMGKLPEPPRLTLSQVSYGAMLVSRPFAT